MNNLRIAFIICLIFSNSSYSACIDETNRLGMYFSIDGDGVVTQVASTKADTRPVWPWYTMLPAVGIFAKGVTSNSSTITLPTLVTGTAIGLAASSVPAALIYSARAKQERQLTFQILLDVSIESSKKYERFYEKTYVEVLERLDQLISQKLLELASNDERFKQMSADDLRNRIIQLTHRELLASTAERLNHEERACKTNKLGKKVFFKDEKLASIVAQELFLAF